MDSGMSRQSFRNLLMSGQEIDGSKIEVTWAKPADKGDPARTQTASPGKQLMDWSLNGDADS